MEVQQYTKKNIQDYGNFPLWQFFYSPISYLKPLKPSRQIEVQHTSNNISKTIKNQQTSRVQQTNNNIYLKLLKTVENRAHDKSN